MPMGGQAGTSVEVAVTGENIDDSRELLFSNPKITAQPKLTAEGNVENNKFLVTIAADAPQGIHEARLMTRLGVSSPRAFSVGSLPEVTRDKPNTSSATAMPLKPDVVCNAFVTGKAVDYYVVQATQGKRLIVDCAAAGIDSKLTAVLIVADSAGHDLLVNRRGGVLDFTPPADGSYFIKVHDLTYQGGTVCFYRLALLEPAGTDLAGQQPSTATVSSFSWTPDDKFGLPEVAEVEPNDKQSEAQKITLPCEIAGRFFPAGDVDTFEFEAKKGEQWWVEVVSERLGLPTDPFVLVQRVTREGTSEKLDDVAELNDIPTPVSVSTNGNTYTGPPYNAGSANALGKVEIKEDGLYRLQLRDLFGGTRNDPRNVYKLILRKAAPDFALVAWALHMETRNQDRAALSKPIALRGGGTLALEVVAVRRDGFDGEIELFMEDLPQGMSACGLKIPPGKNRGIMLITAAENAPRSLAIARMFGALRSNGAPVSRPCRLASVAWPVKDSEQETPCPRLLADVPVSVGGSESAPISIAPSENKVWQAKAGDKLTIPLRIVWRGEFTSGLKLRTFGAGFESAKEIDVASGAPTAQAVLDLAALKTPPGEHVIAFYGSATIKYRYNLAAVQTAQEAQKKAEQEAIALAAEAKKLADEARAAPAEKKAEAENAANEAAQRQKTADAAKVAAAQRLKTATDAAAPTLTSDIVVSEPIRISITPADGK